MMVAISLCKNTLSEEGLRELSSWWRLNAETSLLIFPKILIDGSRLVAKSFEDAFSVLSAL
jgi:hypothetical protein